MTDPNTQTVQTPPVDDNTQTGQQGAKTGGIVVDKSKTSEQYIREAEAFYIVPVIIREKFPDLIKLIVETESMDKEEREYWLSIMPVMTEDQIVKLRNILLNEKEQLYKIDQDYQRTAKKPVAALDEQKMKEKQALLKQAEEKSEAQEVLEEKELLKQLENI